MKDLNVSARRRRLMTLMAGSVVACGFSGIVSGATRLAGFRLVQQDTVQLYLDLDARVRGIQIFALTDPHRLVIDLPATSVATALPEEPFPDGVVAGVRYAHRADGTLRLVLDLRRSIDPGYRYRLVDRQAGARLVVDLGVKGEAGFVRARRRQTGSRVLRDVMVAIDAGHGGKDPGAIGPAGTREKDVVLQIARRLHRRLTAMRGISPIMIRDTDDYVELRERIEIAHQRGADLFVSLHADAFHRREARGSSIYTLSGKGATSEAAAYLARKEDEQAALFGEVNLSGMRSDVASTVLDLVQNSTLESSLDIAGEVLAQLKHVGHVHKPNVEQANFSVLRSPDIPSVLVETAFISNPDEERKLNQAEYQDRLATALAEGLSLYLQRRAPDGTILAAMRRQADG